MNPNRPHSVYRCYDEDGLLLYIGCTQDVNQRLDVHRAAWGNPASAVLNFRMASHTEVEYPTKAAAREAERAAIRDEAPLCNLHHQSVSITPAERMAKLETYLDATRPEPSYPGIFDQLDAAFSRGGAA